MVISSLFLAQNILTLGGRGIIYPGQHDRDVSQTKRRNQMSRLDAMVSGDKTEDKKVSATCTLTREENDRIKDVMEKFGIGRRSEFVYNCVMDGLERLELERLEATDGASAENK
jgi:hypothetical protein